MANLMNVLLLVISYRLVNAAHPSDDMDTDREGRNPFGDEARLLRKLLRGYEKAVRPVNNASKSLTVEVDFSLTQILHVDEKNQVITTNVWISQQWSDEKLVWDPKEYNGLKKLRIPPDLIWRPDIVLYNGVDDFGDKVYSQCLAMVNSSGVVLWGPIANLKSSCKLDLTYFPFDDQACTLKFGSWTYDGSQVDLINQSSVLEMRQYIKNGGWDVIKTEVIRNEVTYPCCPSEPYPDVTFTIYLRRRSLYYVINVVVPCILLSCVSLLGFWLPVGTGEKVSLGLTVLLAFYVLGLSLADRIPETSEYIPLIGLYLTIIMLLTATSVAMCVFVIQIHSKGEKSCPVPPWFYRFSTKYLAKLVCVSSNYKHFHHQHSALDCDEQKPFKKDYIDKTDYIDSKADQMPQNGNNGYKTVPIDKSCNFIIRQDSNNQGHVNANGGSLWLRQHDLRKRDQNMMPLESGDFEYLHSREEVWPHLAQIWDRFFLWIEFITVTLSTFAILLIMPLFKKDSVA